MVPMLEPGKPDIRSQILAAATRLFAAHGFDGTSLTDIASAVGIKKPSLLYHFASKEELRQAVLEALLSRWNETLPKLLLAASGEDQFDGITRELVSFFNHDPDRARLIVREALDRPEDMQRRLAEHVRPVVANLAVYIKKGQAHGDLHADVDPEAYLFQTITLLLCGVAFSDRFSALMPKQSAFGAPAERLMSELLRIAKAGLFRDETRGYGAGAAPAASDTRINISGRTEKQDELGGTGSER